MKYTCISPGIAGSYGKHIYALTFKVAIPLYTSSCGVWEIGWFASSPLLGVATFYFSHSYKCELVFTVLFICISPVPNDDEHVFMCLPAIPVPFLVKRLFKAFVHVKNEVVYDSVSEF